jgi:hypothetical protein
MARGVTHGIEPLDIPILVNCRDRVSCLRQLVDWLEGAAYQRIYLIDNESSYPPLLDYYEHTPHNVIRLDENLGHRAPWKSGVVDQVATGPYVVTDPDVLPTEQCPKDAVAVLLDVLDRHPSACKAGLGLVIDDIPEHFALAGYVRAWEEQHWQNEIEPGLFSASVDTTFAAYRPGVAFARRPAIRTGPPYLARHLPWYVHSNRLDDEEKYYRDHALPGSHTWNRNHLPAKLDGYFHRSRWAKLRRGIRKVLS